MFKSRYEAEQTSLVIQTGCFAFIVTKTLLSLEEIGFGSLGAFQAARSCFTRYQALTSRSRRCSSDTTAQPRQRSISHTSNMKLACLSRTTAVLRVFSSIPAAVFGFQRYLMAGK